MSLCCTVDLTPLNVFFLFHRFKMNGGYIESRKVHDIWELHGRYDVVMNCTGIGARDLTGDSSIYPVRGQVLEVHAPWIKHFVRVEDGATYIYPGQNGTIIGGTKEKHDWRLLPDAQTSKEILHRCCNIEPSLHGVTVIKEKVGLRPTRAALRLEHELLRKNKQQLPTIHNYGHGGGGFSVHRGTAKAATDLLLKLIPMKTDIYCKSKL